MDRKIVSFNFLYDYGIGTLWLVREDVWRERIDGYDESSKRAWHPALSIARALICDSLEAVPMLHGTSKGSNRRSFVVRNVTKEGGAEKRTYFRMLAPIFISDFVDLDKNDKLVAQILEVKRVVRNEHRPKLNDEEMRKLKKWLARKGW